MTDDQAIDLATSLRQLAADCRRIAERNTPRHKNRLLGQAMAYQQAAERIEAFTPGAPKIVYK
jgi:hypothetical protein